MKTLSVVILRQLNQKQQRNEKVTIAPRSFYFYRLPSILRIKT